MELPREIYAIKHNVTKRIYVGSSKYPQKRFAAHLSMLRNRKHTVEDMQKDFNEYGDNFTFIILETITEFEKRDREYEIMELLESNIRGKGYNYKDHVNFKKRKGKITMGSREKLFNFILSLTDEEAERIAAFLKNNQNKPICGGKENK